MFRYFEPSVGGPAVPNLLYQRMGGNLFDFSLAAQLVGRLVFAAATLVFPISFAVAILRYRLWDIDLIIRRTLVYGTLTAFVAGLFTALIGLSQRLFVVFTGEQSDAAIVITTLFLKIATLPLTLSASRSGKRMQKLMPHMTAIREKYKDDEIVRVFRTFNGWSEPFRKVSSSHER